MPEDFSPYVNGHALGDAVADASQALSPGRVLARLRHSALIRQLTKAHGAYASLCGAEHEEVYDAEMTDLWKPHRATRDIRETLDFARR